MAHSPEPWTIDSGFVVSSEGTTIFGAFGDDDGEPIPGPVPIRENLDRIVACVNFCRGIPTERLLELSDTADRIEAKRALDELKRRGAAADENTTR